MTTADRYRRQRRIYDTLGWVLLALALVVMQVLPLLAGLPLLGALWLLDRGSYRAGWIARDKEQPPVPEPVTAPRRSITPIEPMPLQAFTALVATAAGISEPDENPHWIEVPGTLLFEDLELLVSDLMPGGGSRRFAARRVAKAPDSHGGAR